MDAIMDAFDKVGLTRSELVIAVFCTVYVDDE
ncbi:hypothetical protein BOM_0267 [Borrelia miyamotoi FR64b]|nr:hypothetical protein BOM_0267 [Borrelia miyamotoi FR64b]